MKNRIAVTSAFDLALVLWWVCAAMAYAECGRQVEAQSLYKCEGSAVLFLACPTFKFFRVEIFRVAKRCIKTKLQIQTSPRIGTCILLRVVILIVPKQYLVNPLCRWSVYQ